MNFMNTLLILFSLCVNWSFADRTNYKIYTNLMANNFCFRRLNATHQIGCSSSMSGNVGIVYVVDTMEDLTWVTQTGPDYPYVAALSEPFFTFGNLTELKESGRVAGVLVLHGEEEVSSNNGFSPDEACPNRNFGLYTEKDFPEYASCKKGFWNPDNPALGMAFEDWGMPVFLLTNLSDVENIRKNCFVKFNKPRNGTLRPWPLCACQLSSAMHAAKDSPTCMRRSSMFTSLTHTAPTKLCDPLSSNNIVTTLFPTNASEELRNRSLIIVAARLDSFSMFDNIAPGADSSLTGLVTLLSVANTLSDMQESMSRNKSDKNVLFAIFNGEAYGYIGSSRAVYDMQNQIFPVTFDPSYSQPAQISLKHISHFIEVTQLGASSEFWIHSDPISTSKDKHVNDKVQNLIKKVQDYGKKDKQDIKNASSDHPLPPASFQSFLRRDLSIPGIVITSFNDKFSNKYYNSRYDTLDHLGNRSILSKRLANISRVISSTVYNLVTGTEPPPLKDNEQLIDQMLECYLENSSCQLFQEIAPPQKKSVVSKSEPLPTYVSVLNQGYPNYITVYTRYLTAYLTGEHLTGYTADNCTAVDHDQIFSYHFMAGNGSEVCVKSTVMLTLALTPAFELNDWTTTEYSTWTESVWQMSSVTIFLHPSRAHEGLVLGVGVFVVALSSLLVYYINKRASILFGVRGLIGC